jgi:NAD(P)-dependent dehydrogenase (short-subunit alcohol dehydrogenase family)
MTGAAPDLSGKVAFITGGGTGIGAGIAHALADAGASVVIGGRRKEVLASTADAIEQRGGRVIGITFDVTDIDQLRAAVDEVVGELGRLDIVVANAGAPPAPGPVLDMDPDDWQRTIELNLTGTWNTAHVTVPHLIASGGGHLLVVGSSAGRSRNAEWVGAYGAAKAGVAHLVRVMAVELAQYDVAVNELTPGLVITAGIGAVDGMLAESTTALIRDEMGEWLKEPDEIGRLALYVLSLPTNGTSGQSFNLERNR